MKKSEAAAVRAEHVLAAFVRIDRDGPAPFGKSRDWDVVHLGRRYPPKAVFAFAYEIASGNSLAVADGSFTGAHEGAAHDRLRELGFVVEAKPTRVPTFMIGAQYSRKDVMQEAGVEPLPTGGNWFTGYHQFDGAFYLFCGVGTPGRTGHDYDNRFDGPDLVWHGKTGSNARQRTILDMTAANAIVHVFYREASRELFTYAGRARPVDINQQGTPVQIRWALGPDEPEDGFFPDQVVPQRSGPYVEGSTMAILVNAYERNLEARRECLRAHGTACAVCKTDFARTYGDELGHGFIHVHHLRPLSEIRRKYAVDPVKDLVPVCPNCHAMLHRTTPPLSIQELREIWLRHGGREN